MREGDRSSRYTFSSAPGLWVVRDAAGAVLIRVDDARTVVREDSGALQEVPVGIAVRWPEDVPPQLLDGPGQFLDSFENLPADPVPAPGRPCVWAGRAAWEFTVHTMADAEPIVVVIDDASAAVVAMLAPGGEAAWVTSWDEAPVDTTFTEPVLRDWTAPETSAGPEWELAVPAFWPAGVGHDLLEAGRDGSSVVRLNVPGSPWLARLAPGSDASPIGRGRHVHRWTTHDGWIHCLVVDEPLTEQDLEQVIASIRLLRPTDALDPGPVTGSEQH